MYLNTCIKFFEKCLDTTCGKVVRCSQVFDNRLYNEFRGISNPQRKCLKDLSTLSKKRLMICGHKGKTIGRKQDGLLLQFPHKFI